MSGLDVYLRLMKNKVSAYMRETMFEVVRDLVCAAFLYAFVIMASGVLVVLPSAVVVGYLFHMVCGSVSPFESGFWSGGPSVSLHPESGFAQWLKSFCSIEQARIGFFSFMGLVGWALAFWEHAAWRFSK